MAEISTTRIVRFKDERFADVEFVVNGDEVSIQYSDNNGVAVPLAEITQFAELLLSWASTGGRST